MLKNKTIPKSAGSPSREKKPSAKDFNSDKHLPCWRLSFFDKDGPWGMCSLSCFTFDYTESIMKFVVDNELNKVDDALQKLHGKKLDSLADFWSRIRGFDCDAELSSELVRLIESSAFSNAFMDKIYPKLREFERITWEEIKKQTHRKKDKMVSNNHDVYIKNMSDKAKDRLNILKYNDVDAMFSLRLEGTVRIYGIRDYNALNIVWIDYNHEVYPVGQQ